MLAPRSLIFHDATFRILDDDLGARILDVGDAPDAYCGSNGTSRHSRLFVV
jgi:hypothetical protein